VLERALRNVRDGFLGLAYPEHCRVCGDPVESWDDGVVCARCWCDPDATKILNGSVCDKCGVLVSRSTNPGARARFCGMCSSLPFAAARACGAYSGGLEASILFLKVTPHICPRLRQIICNTFAEHRAQLESDVVAPIPLHRLRERQRGFNQAAIIARMICREFDLPFDDRALIRVKDTERHRAGLDAIDRAQSVERAFKVKAPHLLEGVSVMLVDDVYTTGSTVSAAAHSLIEAGAQRVNVLAIARAGDK
jgi:ComF family protein